MLDNETADCSSSIADGTQSRPLAGVHRLHAVHTTTTRRQGPPGVRTTSESGGSQCGFRQCANECNQTKAWPTIFDKLIEVHDSNAWSASATWQAASTRQPTSTRPFDDAVVGAAHAMCKHYKDEAATLEDEAQGEGESGGSRGCRRAKRGVPDEGDCCPICPHAMGCKDAGMW